MIGLHARALSVLAVLYALGVVNHALLTLAFTHESSLHSQQCRHTGT